MQVLLFGWKMWPAQFLHTHVWLIARVALIVLSLPALVPTVMMSMYNAVSN